MGLAIKTSKEGTAWGSIMRRGGRLSNQNWGNRTGKTETGGNEEQGKKLEEHQLKKLG